MDSKRHTSTPELIPGIWQCLNLLTVFGVSVEWGVWRVAGSSEASLLWDEHEQTFWMSQQVSPALFSFLLTPITEQINSRLLFYTQLNKILLNLKRCRSLLQMNCDSFGLWIDFCFFTPETQLNKNPTFTFFYYLILLNFIL